MTKVDPKVPFPVTDLISQSRLLLMRDKNLTATLLFGGEVLKKASWANKNETPKANYFAKEIGCPDMDMECMRSKSIKVFTAFSAISSFSFQYVLVHLVFQIALHIRSV